MAFSWQLRRALELGLRLLGGEQGPEEWRNESGEDSEDTHWPTERKIR